MAGRSATARTLHSADAGRGHGRALSRAGQGCPGTGTVCLREDFHPGAGSPLTVDRDAGVIRRVKILGWESKNNRRYDPEAAKAAKALYEGCKVYCDHPQKADETRPTDKTLGIFRAITWTPEGLYADLHYLKSHPMAERVCEDAERGLGVFGMSHNADGETEVRDGVTVVVRITEVRSVDLVTDPATVSNLWESRQGKPPMKTTLKKLLESLTLPDRLARQRKALLEMGDELGDMPVEEPPAPEAPAAEDWRTTLGRVAGELAASEDAEAHDIARKIMAMLKPAAAEVAEEDESEEKDDEEEEVQESDEKDKKESAKRRKTKAGAHRLTEDRAKRLCKLANVEPEPELLEAMQASTEETALRLLEWAKGKAGPTPASAAHGWGAKGARSQSPGTRQTVTESKQTELKFPTSREETRKLVQAG